VNVSDVMIRIKRQFGDESGVQVTDDDILRWINDGQHQIVTQNEGLLEKSSYTNTVALQQEYTLPTDILILRSVHLKDSTSGAYFNIKYYSFAEFDQYVDGWDQTVSDRGYPTLYTIYAGIVKLFPLPETSQTNGLKIYYNRAPVDVVTSGDSLDIPLMYHEALVKYCLQQAYEMDEDFEAAQAKASQMDADISLLRGRDDWKKQDTYPMITVNAEDW
jgi:hypothetical protein